jgi:N-formylglutamate amidohydrolase
MFMTITSNSDDVGSVLATAIHAGHELRLELRTEILLDDDVRRREEDPFTDDIAGVVPTHVTVHRSRFEVDVNRDRDASVYRTPEDAWGLAMWRQPPAGAVIERSRSEYDEFYASMCTLLDRMAEIGPFVVLDIHSYNHRRRGPRAPSAPSEENPDINVGTGSLDRSRFSPVVNRFVAELGETSVDGHRLDVRENVRFQGGHFSRWVNQHYPDRGCALAIEFKKTFMDEWTGALDVEHLTQLGEAVRGSLPALARALAYRT